ncbi:MAG: hypothetical protein ACXVZV_01645, partial [Terriglobales bacterium]
MPANVLTMQVVLGGVSRVEANGDVSLTRGRMPGQQTAGRIDDTNLIREAQQGNHRAFEELIRQYDQQVLRLALHLT